MSGASRASLRNLQYSGRGYGDDDELMEHTRRDKESSLRAVPDDEEKAKFFKMSGVMDKYKKPYKGSGDTAEMSYHEKVTHASLGTKLRSGGQRIDGQYEAPYQQAMVVISVEMPFGEEFDDRKKVPPSERVGLLGSGRAMDINEGVICFAKSKTFRTSPAGFPDTKVFAHLGGLDKRDQLQVVGIAMAPRQHIQNGPTDFTVAVAGTPWTLHTGETRLPAMSRLVAIPKGVVSSTPDGDVPYFTVTGHSEETLYPAIEPFEDVDVSVAASKINEDLFKLLDKLVDENKLADWFERVDTMFKTELFNEDGYDFDIKKPIQYWAEWSAIHHALTDLEVFNVVVPLDNGERDLDKIHSRIKAVLDMENNSPDFARFIDVFGSDLDTEADQQLEHELRAEKLFGDGAETIKHVRMLRRVVEMHMNRALMEQLSWNSRMFIGRTLRSVLPGQPIDLLV